MDFFQQMFLDEDRIVDFGYDINEYLAKFRSSYDCAEDGEMQYFHEGSNKSVESRDVASGSNEPGHNIDQNSETLSTQKETKALTTTGVSAEDGTDISLGVQVKEVDVARETALPLAQLPGTDRLYLYSGGPDLLSRWMIDIHDQFLTAVKELGGPLRATPKDIKKKMKIGGLRLNNIERHLQICKDELWSIEGKNKAWEKGISTVWASRGLRIGTSSRLSTSLVNKSILSHEVTETSRDSKKIQGHLDLLQEDKEFQKKWADMQQKFFMSTSDSAKMACPYQKSVGVNGFTTSVGQGSSGIGTAYSQSSALQETAKLTNAITDAVACTEDTSTKELSSGAVQMDIDDKGPPDALQLAKAVDSKTGNYLSSLEDDENWNPESFLSITGDGMKMDWDDNAMESYLNSADAET